MTKKIHELTIIDPSMKYLETIFLDAAIKLATDKQISLEDRFELLDGHIADSANKKSTKFSLMERVKLVTDISSALYQDFPDFNDKTQYTTPKKAVSFYENVLRAGLINDDFHYTFSRFAENVATKIEGVTIIKDIESENKLSEITNSVNYEVFADFKRNLEQDFKEMQESYNPKSKDKGLKSQIISLIPERLKDTIFEKHCYKMARDYVTAPQR